MVSAENQARSDATNKYAANPSGFGAVRTDLDDINLRIAALEKIKSNLSLPSSSPRPIQRLPATCSIEDAVAAMDRDGAVILERLVTSEHCDRFMRELQPYVEATPNSAGFGGATTRRTGSILARSEASWSMIGHPLVLGVCDRILGDQALQHCAVLRKDAPKKMRFPWQLHLTQSILIGPGGKPQPLHQDKGFAVFDFGPTVEPEVSTMWAITDFTEENGATRVVAGSHKPGAGPPNKFFEYEDSASAAMPRGSVLLYTGSAYHGSGKNTSNEHRMGLNVDYCLSFLRQEENQYLSCPPWEARRLPRELQKLIGYEKGGGFLGYVSDGFGPEAAMRPEFDVTDPTATARLVARDSPRFDGRRTDGEEEVDDIDGIVAAVAAGTMTAMQASARLRTLFAARSASGASSKL